MTLDLTSRHDPRVAAAALVPEFGYVPVPRRGHLHRGLIALTVIVTIAIVASMFYGGFAYRAWSLNRQPQISTPAAHDIAADSSTYKSFAGTQLGYAPAPVALTYHDVGPNKQNSQYVVSAAAFESQMRMLSQAGFHSLTAEQFLGYQAGTYHPVGRTFLLTFDDGTQGLWTYADKILARYHFSAVSFLITGRVGTHRPYYLTWREVEAMHKSGRWDFESHTHDLHSSVPTGTDGLSRPDLGNRLYLPGGKVESMPAFVSRVTADLKASQTDLIAHKLPLPRLFAWPFSDVSVKIPDPSSAAVVEHLVKLMFSANFTDVGGDPQPLSQRVMAGRLVERLEQLRSTTAQDMFGRLTAMETLPPSAAADPLSIDQHWYEVSGHAAPVDVTATSVTPDASSLRYVKMTWAPQRTADWDDYTVTARVNGLDQSTGGTGGLRVRADSPAETMLRVSNDQAQITSATGQSLGTFPVSAEGQHQLTVTVGQDFTRYAVDGTVLLQTPNGTGPQTTGGFGLATQRASTSLPFVSYSDIHVAVP